MGDWVFSNPQWGSLVKSIQTNYVNLLGNKILVDYDSGVEITGEGGARDLQAWVNGRAKILDGAPAFAWVTLEMRRQCSIDGQWQGQPPEFKLGYARTDYWNHICDMIPYQSNGIAVALSQWIAEGDVLDEQADRSTGAPPYAYVVESSSIDVPHYLDSKITVVCGVKLKLRVDLKGNGESGYTLGTAGEAGNFAQTKRYISVT